MGRREGGRRRREIRSTSMSMSRSTSKSRNRRRTESRSRIRITSRSSKRSRRKIRSRNRSITLNKELLKRPRHLHWWQWLCHSSSGFGAKQIVFKDSIAHISHHQSIPTRKANANAKCIQVITKKFVNWLHNCYKFKSQDY